jgi:hypothetical protein
MVPSDMKARLFGYSCAKIDTGVDSINYFQIAVLFGAKGVHHLM